MPSQAFRPNSLHRIGFRPRRHIELAERDRPVLHSRHRSAIAEDVRIDERNVHRHRADLAAIRVKVERIADLVSVMTGARPFPINQLDCNLRSFAHSTSLFKHRFVDVIVCANRHSTDEIKKELPAGERIVEGVVRVLARDTQRLDEITKAVMVESRHHLFRKGDRIAQMVVAKVEYATFVETDNVKAIGEDRGGGFGSSGVN